MKKQRKMGHVTVVADSLSQAQSRLHAVMGSAPLNGVPRAFPLGATAAAASVGVAQVGIIMGSDSDLPVMKAAAQILDSFGVNYEVSAEYLYEFLLVYLLISS